METALTIAALGLAGIVGATATTGLAAMLSDIAGYLTAIGWCLLGIAAVLLFVL